MYMLLGYYYYYPSQGIDDTLCIRKDSKDIADFLLSDIKHGYDEYQVVNVEQDRIIKGSDREEIVAKINTGEWKSLEKYLISIALDYSK